MRIDRRGVSTFLAAGVVIVAVLVAGISYVLYSSGGKVATSPTSSTTQSSTSTSGQAGTYRVVLQMLPSIPLVSPDVVANYTLRATVLGSPDSPLNFGASAPSGVTVRFSPAQIQPGSGSGTLSVSFVVAASVAVGTYPLNVTVSSSGQTTSQEFTFEVVKYLVVMVGENYAPYSLTVPVGSTVLWVRLNGGLSQYDNGAHNVVFNTIVASSPTLDQYQSWSYTFSQAGTFVYHCTFHPGMNGQVVVA
jgi:plastocyanin